MSETYEIKITALGNEGQGVGLLPTGKKIFIPGTIPGDLCEARIASQSSKFAKGLCLRVLEPSPDRILSFGNFVPGADLAHMSYEASLRYKSQKVSGCLTRIGGIEPAALEGVMQEIISCKEPLNYRNHMQYKIVSGKLCLVNSFTMKPEDPGNPILEYRIFTRVKGEIERVFENAPTLLFDEVVVRGSERTHEILLELVSSRPETHEVTIGNVRHYIEASGFYMHLKSALQSDGYRLTGLTLRISSTATEKRTHSGLRVVIEGSDYYEEILFGRKFRIHSGAFFQVNIPQAELLYKCAGEFTGDAQSILDLYCGTGSIGLSILKPGQSLMGLETVPEAIRAAKENALLNGISCASFFIKPAEKIDFTGLSLPEPMAVVVDPPRKGLDDALIMKLISRRPGKLCYISCDPATLARDIKLLLKSGAFTLQSVRPVDMFPWTHHVETVVLMSKNEN